MRRRHIVWAAVALLGLAFSSAPSHDRVAEAAAAAPLRQLSPQGKLIAYTQGYNVYISDLSGKGKVQVTSRGSDRPDGYSYPWYQWSPDGKYLFLVRFHGLDGAGALLLIDSHGKLLSDLISNLAPPDIFPSWASDADQIAYDAARNGSSGSSALYLNRIDVQGHSAPLAGLSSTPPRVCAFGNDGPDTPSQLLDVQENESLQAYRWSTRAHLVLWFPPCGKGLIVADYATGAIRHLGMDASWSDLAVSAQGLAAVTAFSSPTAYTEESSVKILDLRTGQVKAEIPQAERPAWSADGRWLFYIVRTAQPTMGQQTADQAYDVRIMRARPDGSNALQLVEQNAYDFGPLQPAADGSGVVFTSIDNDLGLARHVSGLLGPIDPATMALYGPRERIEYVDAHGKMTVLIRDAGRPAVQP